VPRDRALSTAKTSGRLRVLFFVDGFTDIRFVVGLSEVCDLTMALPAHAYVESTLKERVASSGARVKVHEIEGGRLTFQSQSFAYLWSVAQNFDVILSQEMLRGSLNATIIGALRHVPVVTTLATSPVDYFKCRRERGQIDAATSWLGTSLIRALMTINGRLATRCLALGPYLCDVSSRICARTEMGYYYGVDTELYRPADDNARARLRRRLGLPASRFLVVLASRISHEKDPETVLHAVARARDRGLDAVLLNLGGGYEQFLALADSLGIPDHESWVMGRPAAHPMADLPDYFRSADLVVQGSLAEGFGLSPLEALACETPVVATNVDGMAAHLRPYARLTPRRDVEAMAEAILDIASNPSAARVDARRGREYVRQYWNRSRAFAELHRSLTAAAGYELAMITGAAA
jgi:glycosyltransferase involved in cell wall biosynthesis